MQSAELRPERYIHYVMKVQPFCNHVSIFYYIDAKVIDGPSSIGSYVFVGQATCNGHEEYFNECIHEIQTSNECTRAAVSCGQRDCDLSAQLPVCTLMVFF